MKSAARLGIAPWKPALATDSAKVTRALEQAVDRARCSTTPA